MSKTKKASETAEGLEQKFEKLEELIETMSDEEISLEEAFDAYSRGMELLRQCSEQIDLVEKKVLVLSSQGETEELEDIGEF